MPTVSSDGAESWVGARAREIAAAVQRGDVTAVGVVAHHLEHAGRAGSALTAVRTLESLAEAAIVDEQPDLGYLPLAGVPVLVTEDIPVAGLPQGQDIAREDDEAVRRLRGAGALVLGAVRASAGGITAAVAAGLAPLGYGTIAAGLTARWAGLVSISAGDRGVVARSAGDAALGYAALAGASGPPPSAGRMRVALPLRSPRYGGESLTRAARVLVGFGHDVVLRNPPSARRGGPGEGWLNAGRFAAVAMAPRPRQGTAWRRAGLPVVTLSATVPGDPGVILVGPPGAELSLLALAAQVEEDTLR